MLRALLNFCERLASRLLHRASNRSCCTRAPRPNGCRSTDISNLGPVHVYKTALFPLSFGSIRNVVERFDSSRVHARTHSSPSQPNQRRHFEMSLCARHAAQLRRWRVYERGTGTCYLSGCWATLSVSACEPLRFLLFRYTCQALREDSAVWLGKHHI